MKKKLYSLSLLVILNLNLIIAQEVQNYFYFRAYNYSLLLSLSNAENNSYQFSAYGAMMQGDSGPNSYLYQGQEYVPELDLNLFPSRAYSALSKRFLQVDPKNQYASPYLFVGADPVNWVDPDGNIGKPLVLYQEDLRRPNSKTFQLRRLQENIPDAYYVPMADFMNKEPIEVPEWNGNVFLTGHSNTNEGLELTVEAGPDPENFRMKYPQKSIIPNPKEGVFSHRIDAKNMGSMLAEFSEYKNIPLKNVIAGGCEGTMAAKKIKEEVSSYFRGDESKIPHTMGFKEHFSAFWSGPYPNFRERLITEKIPFRYHALLEDVVPLFEYDRLENGDVEVTGHYGRFRDQFDVKLDYVEKEGLEGYMNGRIPKELKNFIDVY